MRISRSSAVEHVKNWLIDEKLIFLGCKWLLAKLAMETYNWEHEEYGTHSHHTCQNYEKYQDVENALDFFGKLENFHLVHYGFF